MPDIPHMPSPERPHMPGYGIQPEPEGMLTWEWVADRLAQSRNYWVCSTRPDGRPHAAPVWGVWFEGVLYFGTGETSRKGQNLRANPALSVHLESGDEVVIVEGTVEAVTDLDVLRPMTGAYGAKYPYQPDPEEPGQLWYAVRPTLIMAWREADFPNTATRWRFDGD